MFHFIYLSNTIHALCCLCLDRIVVGWVHVSAEGKMYTYMCYNIGRTMFLIGIPPLSRKKSKI